MLENLDRLFVLLFNKNRVKIKQIETISRKDQTVFKEKVPDSIGWYLAGFVDGEGSFNISLRRKPDYKVGWQPVLSFNVSQKELTILLLMKNYFDCGIIKRRKDGLYSYDVTNPKAIKEIILPFFEKYHFLSEGKKRNYELFKKIAQLMFKKKHLEQKGFRKLVKIREKLNIGKGRKRKYTLNTVLESSETIRQVPV
ncbi:hypothetical protein A2160_04130 [Candidatus Beckwithbacteria bacterium RBG_13_42_9]|uniref:Homing endonuclease LAGLIDADG domain-containing protein n=1 Tax=Candidatus Beckwithbacteria bacterium RBG_13_42_9 TaxID=1797457 RepID=A0A1F5E692_9BACT|nr:MAG: hypothetical protein A2160_04130 [Candidatus Beckwithbacteria bacterium RBG_13_42_9]